MGTSMLSGYIGMANYRLICDFLFRSFWVCFGVCGGAFGDPFGGCVWWMIRAYCGGKPPKEQPQQSPRTPPKYPLNGPKRRGAFRRRPSLGMANYRLIVVFLPLLFGTVLGPFGVRSGVRLEDAFG